jgi:tetratricopeptide (TPR) repeat protein
MRRRDRATSVFPALTVLSALLLAALLMASCSSSPQEIPEDLQPIEYFQQAQKLAMEQNNYQGAIRYYRTFIQRNPDDIQHVVEAQYEIAFLYYKQGQYTRASEEFNKLLSYYESGGQNVLPEWPKILANKIMSRMDEESGSDAQTADSGETSSSEGPSSGSNSSTAE